MSITPARILLIVPPLASVDTGVVTPAGRWFATVK
jgi:hypothetical protein